jgi:hypothetical protein
MITGCSDILEITVVIGAQPETAIDLISKYGVVRMIQVRAHADPYHNPQARAAQDTTQLYLRLKNSLSAEAQAKVALRVLDYNFDDKRYVSGKCLLKVVTMESSIDQRDQSPQPPTSWRPRHRDGAPRFRHEALQPVCQWPHHFTRSPRRNHHGSKT